MAKRTITVNDTFQRGYRYQRVAAPGRGFDPEFAPELTPAEMLRLGVFGGLYMTDCRREFPKSWFARAKLSPGKRDNALNYFKVDASQPLAEWKRKGWLHSGRSARLVSMVLPLPHGPPPRGRRAPDQALEGLPPPHRADQGALRAGRLLLPAAAAPGVAALGV